MVKENLQVDKESYKRLIESVKDYAIFMIDSQGYVISWNRGAEQIQGYTEAEIMGSPFSVFYTVEDVINAVPESDLKKVKELVQEGNIRKITIKEKSGKELMSFPLTIGVVGTVFAPILAAVGAVAALIGECTITVEREDDVVTDIKESTE